MKNTHNEEPLVKVATAPNEALAGMWAELLRNNGIQCLVKPTGPGMAYFSTALVEHYIYVLASDAEAARAILEGDDGEEAAPEET